MGKLPRYKEDLLDVNIGNVDVDTIAAGTTVIGAIRAIGNTAKTGAGTDYYLLVDANGKLSIRPLTNTDVVTVEQSAAASLKATVTQLAKDRTVTGSVTAVSGTAVNLKAEVTQASAARTVTCDTAVNLKNTEASAGDIKTAVEAIQALNGVSTTKFQSTFTSADAQSAAPVKAKTADNKMYILSLVVSTDTEMNIQFQDDTGTPNVLIEQMYFAANGGAALSFPPQAPLIVDTNKDFDVIASAAGNVSVTITGYLAA